MPDGGGESDWHYLDAYSYNPLSYSGGELPWAMEWIFDNIVQYLKDGNWGTAAELMGAICHFTGDATMPLHATYDYWIGGMHTTYETAVNNHIGEISIPDNYVPQELDDITNAALATLEESFSFTGNTEDDLSYWLRLGISWNDTIKSITENRVRAGVQFTANVWYTAMIHAGLTIQAPTLTSPSDGSTTTDNTPTFAWTSVGGTNFCDFQLASDNSFTSGVVTVKGLSTTSYTSVEPLTDGEWYWRVRAGDNSTDVGLWSQTYWFTILTPHHDPIYIDGNAGFTIPDPVNGGGSGTQDDPYIIENWDISAQNANGIEIRNTTAHFIIRNCLVENGGYSYYGIYLDNVVNGKIENCTCDNNWDGIFLLNFSNNTLTNNSCSNNYYGIELYSSNNNRIYHNNFTNNATQANDSDTNYWDDGYPSGGNYWSDYTGGDNYRSENQDIPGSDGIGDTPYSITGGSNLDRYPLMSPVVNGLVSRPSIYIDGDDNFIPANGVVGGSGTENDPYIIENWDINAENANGIWIAGTTARFVIRNCYVHDGWANYNYGIYLKNVMNGTVDNNTAENNYYGIYLFEYSDNNTLTNNTSKNNSYHGIHLQNSSNCTLNNNTCENNSYRTYLYYGIYLDYSNNNTLTNNTSKNNGGAGIQLVSSSKNILTSNTCLNNGWDETYSSGITLNNSTNNNLSNNFIENNGAYGIFLCNVSINNVIRNNFIENNGFVGIGLNSDNNRIYHNNFMNNSTQAEDMGTNYWDDGYPSGGNYWSDYTGSDANGDGIGDTPYHISRGSNQDRYPLMSPFVLGPVIIVSGTTTAYNNDTAGLPPLKFYKSSPLLMAATRVGAGAVVAAGMVNTCRDGNWNNTNNTAPYFDVLLDKAFQWMKSGATKVLWYGGYGAYTTLTTCRQLENALEVKGYTLTGVSTTPINSSLLSGYDILVIPQLQLGSTGTGGNPDNLPDADVAAIKSFVEGGGGLLIMEGADYNGRNYNKVHNKILRALGTGFYFQDDQVVDDNSKWGATNFWPIAVIDNTTAIGSAYQAATGKNEIGLYSICSLIMEENYDVSVRISPLSQQGNAEQVLTFEATIVNIGTKSDNYTLTVVDELGWNPTISSNRINLENGENAKENVLVTVPAGLTEKVANWITLTAVGDSGARDNISFRAGNRFPTELPTFNGVTYYPVHPETPRFLGPGLPDLWISPPAVPIITAIKSGYSNDITPKAPWPTLYGQGEFPPLGAAALVGNGRVVAIANAILRDKYFDNPVLANSYVMPLIARWLINWNDPRGDNLLYYVTHTYPTCYYVPSMVTKWLAMLENNYGFNVSTKVGGEITPELLENLDILQLAELMRPLSSEEIQAVVNWVKAGGGLIIMCQADYSGFGAPAYPNAVLDALNSGIKFQDDEVYDENSWVIDGPWFPQVYLLDSRVGNPNVDIWFPFRVSVSISPSSNSGPKGSTLTYTVTVNNTGNVEDSYSLIVTDQASWSPTVSPTSLTLAAGVSGTATLTVTIPSGAAAGASTTITVTATSRADPSVSDSASCSATASAPPPPPGDTVPPPTPSLVSPASGANITDNTPLLDWSDVSDPSGVTYDMSIARDAGFVSIAIQKTGLTASTYDLTPAEALVAGAYYWRARAVDGVGNIGSWSKNWSFIVSIAPPTPPSVEIPLVTPESPATVEVENAAITALEISVLNTVENVRITVQELVDRPGEIAIAAPGAIYRYLEIIEENITDNDIGSVTITFKVEKSWIEGENIDENTITLKRYNPENGGWISLPTVKVSEDATYVYFSATSPGLSYLAVSGTAMTPAPTAFTVSALTISPSQVSVGQGVSISVTVTNTGDLAGTCTVTLKINGIVENTENVTLAGGENRQVMFTISEDIEGTYNVEVGGQTGAFTVAKLPPTPMSWPLIVGGVGAIAIIGIALVLYIRRRGVPRRVLKIFVRAEKNSAVTPAIVKRVARAS